MPYADYGPRKVPEGLTDEQVIFTTDILVTGWTGLEWAGVQPGETVAVYGCGPVGLMAQKSAWLHGAECVIGVDVQEYRLETARRVANSETVNAREGEPAEKIWEMTEGRGADVVVEAVGMEVDANPLQKVADLAQRQAGSTRAVESACKATRRSGRLSIMGVYATEYNNFPLGLIFDKGLRIQQGQSLPHNVHGPAARADPGREAPRGRHHHAPDRPGRSPESHRDVQRQGGRLREGRHPPVTPRERKPPVETLSPASSHGRDGQRGRAR